MKKRDVTPLGRRLKELRSQRGVSLREVSWETDVNDSLLSKIETGLVAKPTQENLNRLADYYEIDPEELWTLADYHISTRLPAAGAYFRSRYHLPNEAVQEMENFLHYIQQKYETTDSPEEADPKVILDESDTNQTSHHTNHRKEERL